MTKTYKYSLSLSPDELLNHAKKEAAKFPGIDFQGDVERGHANGMGFKGRYEATQSERGTDLEITVTKPLWMPQIVVDRGLDVALDDHLVE